MDEPKSKLTTIKKVASWILMVLAIVYDLLPVDLVPDIPFLGWIDDFLITLVAVINLIQNNKEDISPKQSKIMTMIKWGLAIFTVVVVLILILFAALLIKWLS